MKGCNMDAACPVINVIANEPDFRLLTALLYVRSGQPTEKATTRLSLSENDAGKTKSDITGRALTSLPTTKSILRDDQPDLGLLPYHRDRLTAAAEALGWRGMDNFHDLGTCTETLRNALDKHIQGLAPVPPATLESRKVVFMVSKSGEVSVKSAMIGIETVKPTQSLLQRKWVPESLDNTDGFESYNCKVYLDVQPSRPSTLTSQKTSHRCVFTSARERLDIAPDIAPTSQEVLLYNPYGEITEASCSTVYFKRNGVWITPAAICGSMIGVTRRLALDRGLCKQGIVEIKELEANEKIWLSNGVRGFFRGTIMTDAQTLQTSADSEEVNFAKLGAGISPDSRVGRVFRPRQDD